MLAGGFAGGTPARAYDPLCETFGSRAEAREALEEDPSLADRLDAGDGLVCDSFDLFAPVGGATYEGPVEVRGDCGGGTVSVTLDAVADNVTQVAVAGVNAEGTLVSGSATFDPGAVPIDSGPAANEATIYNTRKDSFYFRTADGFGLDLGVTFDGDRMFGRLTITPATCSNLAFSGEVAAAAALPATGSGATRDSALSWWPAAAVALGGALAVGAGLAARRRVD